MICYKCNNFFDSEGWIFDSEKGFAHSSSCPPKAERSEALPGCPPSATGSAGARASDESGADSSGRSADKAVRAFIKESEGEIAKHFEMAMKCKKENDAIGWLESLSAIQTNERCIALARAVSPALAAERERACLPND